MSTLGNRIALYRKQNNYTQEGLANKLNVSSQAISKWENDLSTPDLSLIIELSNIFNISLDKLIKGEDVNKTYYMSKENRKPIDEMVLRINVLSSDGDKIKVNLPMIVIKALIASGQPYYASRNGDDIMKNIDFEYVFSLIEQGVLGTLVEVESGDGDIITIVVE